MKKETGRRTVSALKKRQKVKGKLTTTVSMKAEPIFLQCQVGFMCGSEKQGFRPRAEISFLG